MIFMVNGPSNPRPLLGFITSISAIMAPIIGAVVAVVGHAILTICNLFPIAKLPLAGKEMIRYPMDPEVMVWTGCSLDDLFNPVTS
jgi:hypothetical protein